MMKAILLCATAMTIAWPCAGQHRQPIEKAKGKCPAYYSERGEYCYPSAGSPELVVKRGESCPFGWRTYNDLWCSR